MTNPILLIIGTRPEGIKMMPVYFALKALQVPIALCSTEQHGELLNEVYDLFGVQPDYELKVMKPNQDLFYITTEVLQKMQGLLNKVNPSLVLIQGDTTSSMAASLAAYYARIPVGHIEAGLRTDDIYNPFPEELNRRFISIIAQHHFAPTRKAFDNLLTEGVKPETIYYTGNTVVDALRIIQEKIEKKELLIDKAIVDKIEYCVAEKKQIVLLTVHRRESFNGGIGRILEAVKEFARDHSNVFFFYPVHPNPHVLEAVNKIGLAKLPNLYLCKPLSYKETVYILSHVHWVATDSGGIQEEAISLGKHVLILRDKTERIEGIWAGLALLAGTKKEQIIKYMKQFVAQMPLINDSKKTLIYGDGYAANKIASIIESQRKNVPLVKQPFVERG